jgi:hypothetical protein
VCFEKTAKILIGGDLQLTLAKEVMRNGEKIVGG